MLMFAGSVNALTRTPWNVQFSLSSMHFKNANNFGYSKVDKFNEFNPGIGLEYRWKDNGSYATGGYFKNSLYRTSLYAGYGKEWRLMHFVNFGVLMGAATGYTLPIVPLALPYLSIGYKWADIKTYFMPPIHQSTPGGVGFQLRIPLELN